MFRKIRPNIGTALATRRANELAFDIRQPDIIGPEKRSDGFICREGLSTHFPFAFG
jgi:hypothetical protein